MVNIWTLGYAFMQDETSMSPTPAIATGLNKITIEYGLFDELIINNGSTANADTARETWSYPTLLLAKFQNNLAAGNISFTSSTVSKLRIKRRKIENLTDWWTLAELNFSPTLKFEIFDCINESEQEYEYALIPVSGDETEGNFMTSKILSEFEDTYITDGKSIYKMKFDKSYNSFERVQKTAVFEPLESKYPVVVKNSTNNYEKGSIACLILSENTENAYGAIDKKQEIVHRKQFLDFLNASTSKFIKDGNGNGWLVAIIDNQGINFRNVLSQQIADISCSWVEVGNKDSKSDMYYNTLLPSIS